MENELNNFEMNLINTENEEDNNDDNDNNDNNDNDNDNNNNDNKNNNNIFKLDYESQNVDNNKYFIKWKRLMLEKLGNNAKLIRCSKDKILFFISYDEYKDILKKKNYLLNCPNGHYICRFGKYSFYNKSDSFCCKRRSFSKAIFNFKDKIDGFDFFIFLPGINFLALSVGFNYILFYRVSTKKSKKNGNLENIEDNKIELIEKFHMFIVVPLYTIIYFILDSYFLIILFIISIPFKFYPIRYIFNISQGDFYID